MSVTVSDTPPDLHADAAWQPDGSQATLTLSGRFDAHTLGGLWAQTRTAQDTWLAGAVSNPGLCIDLHAVQFLDGAGLAFLIDLNHAQEVAGGTVTLQGLAPRFEPLLAQYQPFEALFPQPTDQDADQPGFIERLGRSAQEVLDDSRNQITFIGELANAVGWAIRYPRQVRWNDFVNVAVEAGIAALPIVLLVAFLIGVILAFQSAIGLKQFGAETFVANLVSLSIFRELGPLMTAILLAGRSSAAFAAEIGTMTVNNEVDALVTGGIDPIKFLVLPRLLAGVLVAPILSLFSDLVGVLAASLTMMAYKIPLVTFYNAVLNTVDVNDVLSGLTKSVLFGLIISGVGCLRGMETGNGAAAVGLSATRAVVTSLILIVVVDGVFAFISYKTGF